MISYCIPRKLLHQWIRNSEKFWEIQELKCMDWQKKKTALKMSTANSSGLFWVQRTTSKSSLANKILNLYPFLLTLAWIKQQKQIAWSPRTWIWAASVGIWAGSPEKMVCILGGCPCKGSPYSETTHWGNIYTLTPKSKKLEPGWMWSSETLLTTRWWEPP